MEGGGGMEGGIKRLVESNNESGYVINSSFNEREHINSFHVKSVFKNLMETGSIFNDKTITSITRVSTYLNQPN